MSQHSSTHNVNNIYSHNITLTAFGREEAPLPGSRGVAVHFLATHFAEVHLRSGSESVRWRCDKDEVRGRYVLLHSCYLLSTARSTLCTRVQPLS